MLYYLYLLKPLFSPLNIFQYITFRAACAFLSALFISLVTGPGIMRWLRLNKAHKVRVDTPAQHQTKSGTPSMGGLIIYLAMASASLLWARLSNRFVLLFLVTGTILCLLGFVDDYLKASATRKDGLAPYVKMGIQLFLAMGVAGYLYIDPPNVAYATSLSVPYSKEWFIYLGALYVPFCMIVLVGASNAVNLADGLDGLACGTVIFSALTYSLFAYLAGHARFSQYLRIIPVPGAGELTVVLAAALLMLLRGHLAAAEVVDRPPLGGRHQPGARPVRRAFLRPALQRRDQRVLRQFFCETDVARHPRQPRISVV